MATSATSLAPKPAHVPPELVADFDIYNIPVGEEGPQAAWRTLRPGGPLAWSPRNGGHWIANSPESVFRFHRDHEHFTVAELVIPKMGQEYLMIPNQVDPPHHGEYRANILPLFTPDAVVRMGEDVRSLCIELIEEMKPRGTCEFVMDFAFRFPLGIFMRMMDLPDSDRMYLRRLVEGYTDSPDPERKTQSGIEMMEYIDRKIGERIENPGTDAISKITRFTIEGRPYTLAEMRATVWQLMVAGLDTVAGMVCFLAWHLATHPADADYIRSKIDDERAMQEVVQEFLRRYSIVSSSRMVVKDYTCDGVTLKQGEMIILPSAFFNLDESRPEAEKVDFARKNKKHITFGSGIHACAGALLAREEIRIFLEEWLTRLPQTRLDPERPPKLKAMPLNGAQELWLKW